MASASEKWLRLERLQALLASGDAANAAQLADVIGVSRRTIMRDLCELRDQGVLVESDRGRGGGVRLGRGHSGGRVRLNQHEALDLLVALALAEKLATPMSPGTFASTRRKLAALFTPSDRDAIRALRRRILIGEPASERIAASFSFTRVRDLGAVRVAFLERRLLQVEYRDVAGRKSSRWIEPQFLFLSPPAWYVLAWDHLRAAIRAFRVDRILAARVGEQRFGLRPVGPFLEAAEAGVETL